MIRALSFVQRQEAATGYLSAARIIDRTAGPAAASEVPSPESLNFIVMDEARTRAHGPPG